MSLSKSEDPFEPIVVDILAKRGVRNPTLDKNGALQNLLIS